MNLVASGLLRGTATGLTVNMIRKTGAHMTLLQEHLKSRHFDLNLHRACLDDDNFVATLYLYTQTGRLAGFQQYRPHAPKNVNNCPRESRYFTYRTPGTFAVWGMESFHLSPYTLFVTEGVFDACRLTELGVSAVAVLSNNPPTDFRNWLRSTNRHVVAVCDNDAAGRKLAKYAHTAVFTEDHDLGDSTEEFVRSLVNRYT